MRRDLTLFSAGLTLGLAMRSERLTGGQKIEEPKCHFFRNTEFLSFASQTTFFNAKVKMSDNLEYD